MAHNVGGVGNSISRRGLLAAGLLLAVATGAVAVQRQVAMSAAVTNVYVYKYLLYLPPGYDADPSASWPLMIFLHGSGQSGSNLEVVAAAGPTLEIELGRDFPCVVISPQAPATYWDPAALTAFIQDRTQQFRIDPNRIYLTGLSMGGYGTWALAERSPYYFAAVMPLCGGGDPSQAYKLRDLPLWAFHGALDTTVPPARTQEMIDAIRRAGGSPLLTIYPDLGHDVWTTTYSNDAVYTWLFAQSRTYAPPPLPPVGPPVSEPTTVIVPTTKQPTPASAAPVNGGGGAVSDWFAVAIVTLALHGVTRRNGKSG